MSMTLNPNWRALLKVSEYFGMEADGSKLAAEIRDCLHPLCTAAIAIDERCDHDELQSAWKLLESFERAAWKALIYCGRERAHQ